MIYKANRFDKSKKLFTMQEYSDFVTLPKLKSTKEFVYDMLSATKENQWKQLCDAYALSPDTYEPIVFVLNEYRDSLVQDDYEKVSKVSKFGIDVTDTTSVAVAMLTMLSSDRNELFTPNDLSDFIKKHCVLDSQRITVVDTSVSNISVFLVTSKLADYSSNYSIFDRQESRRKTKFERVVRKLELSRPKYYQYSRVYVQDKDIIGILGDTVDLAFVDSNTIIDEQFANCMKKSSYVISIGCAELIGSHNDKFELITSEVMYTEIKYANKPSIMAKLSLYKKIS